ncbi:MAG TPA: hypothetical protein VFL87_00575 [Thermoleophilaceae bacterium]|nr:hypothetical protein [Thermoleophilaceae bacterium]
MIVPLAHAGHVLIELPIYLGPVILLVLWFKLGDWREKRKERRAGRR